MIRIIGVQRCEDPEGEFLLLQNQGSLRINLRGHVVLSECALEGLQLNHSAHAFPDEVLIPAGMYVILRTGSGTPKWGRTKDGAMIYHAYMNRSEPIWEKCSGSVSILSTHHTYAERSTAVTLR